MRGSQVVRKGVKHMILPEPVWERRCPQIVKFRLEDQM